MKDFANSITYKYVKDVIGNKIKTFEDGQVRRSKGLSSAKILNFNFVIQVFT